MDSQKNYIITKAKELFGLYGFKSVTMDDISREAGMSKKTVYNNFDSKKDLISHLIEETKVELTSKIKEIQDQDISSLHKLYKTYLKLVEFSQDSNQVNYWNIKKYYRDLFDNYSSYIGDIVDEIGEHLITEAQWESYIVTNISAKVFNCFIRTALLGAIHNNLLNESELDKYTFQKEFIYFSLRSIVTESGLYHLDKIMLL